MIKPMNNSKVEFEELTWADVRCKIADAKPLLAEIIDEIQPSDEHTFIRIRYPFGSHILNNREFMLPASNKSDDVSLQHSDLPTDIKEKLSYSLTPTGIITQNSVEIYAEFQQRIVPFKLFTKGDVFGVWELITAPKSISIQRAWTWNISAGARSIFMLPSITDNAAHRNIKQQFGIKAAVPTNLFEQWAIFSQIMAAKKSDWATEVIFFTKKWTEPEKNNPAWIKLTNFWFTEAWSQSLNWRNKLTFDFAWEALSRVLEKKRIKPKLYHLQTAKHLIEIGTGAIPGFVAAGQSHVAAPVREIQDAYMEHYGLKYAPILFHPYHLTLGNAEAINAVYYSLQTPTLTESPPDLKHQPSVMSELRELRTLMDIFIETMHDKPFVGGLEEYDLINAITYDYFHNSVDKFNLIANVKDIFADDPRLSLYPDVYGMKDIPEAAQFFRGCVKVAFAK